MPETPQNTGYMIAAYVVAAVVLVGYAVALYLRSSRADGQAKDRRTDAADAQR